jgi:hypothetical protein
MADKDHIISAFSGFTLKEVITKKAEQLQPYITNHRHTAIN